MADTLLYLHNVNLNYTNQLLGSRVHNVTSGEQTALGSMLTAANVGLMVYNIDKSTIATWNGSSWDDYGYSMGLKSFNGRFGPHIQPANGDYHINMISGFPSSNGHNNEFLSNSNGVLQWKPIPAGLSVNQVKTIVGTMMPSEFNFNGSNLTIALDHVNWTKITGAPPFITQETDPTVPAHVKSIQIGQQPNHYLRWSGSQWVSSVIQYSHISGLPVIPTQYTNEMAQDAAAAMLLSGVHTNITFTYDDAANAIHAHATFGGGTEIRFKVGDSGAPAAGASTFTVADCNAALAGASKVEVYRERDLQYEGDDYTYNTSTSILTFTPALLQGERVVIKLYEPGTWAVCTIGSAPANNSFPYTLPLTLS